MEAGLKAAADEARAAAARRVGDAAGRALAWVERLPTGDAQATARALALRLGPAAVAGLLAAGGSRVTTGDLLTAAVKAAREAVAATTVRTLDALFDDAAESVAAVVRDADPTLFFAAYTAGDLATVLPPPQPPAPSAAAAPIPATTALKRTPSKAASTALVASPALALPPATSPAPTTQPPTPATASPAVPVTAAVPTGPSPPPPAAAAAAAASVSSDPRRRGRAVQQSLLSSLAPADAAVPAGVTSSTVAAGGGGTAGMAPSLPVPAHLAFPPPPQQQHQQLPPPDAAGPFPQQQLFAQLHLFPHQQHPPPYTLQPPPSDASQLPPFPPPPPPYQPLPPQPPLDYTPLPPQPPLYYQPLQQQYQEQHGAVLLPPDGAEFGMQLVQPQPVGDAGPGGPAFPAPPTYMQPYYFSGSGGVPYSVDGVVAAGSEYGGGDGGAYDAGTGAGGALAAPAAEPFEPAPAFAGEWHPVNGDSAAGGLAADGGSGGGDATGVHGGTRPYRPPLPRVPDTICGEGVCYHYISTRSCPRGDDCIYFHISTDWEPGRPRDAGLIEAWERQTGARLHPEADREWRPRRRSPPAGLRDRYRERRDDGGGGGGSAERSSRGRGPSPTPSHGSSSAHRAAAAAAAIGGAHIPRRLDGLDLEPFAQFAMELVHDPPPTLAAAADGDGFVPSVAVEAEFQTNPGAPRRGSSHTGRKFTGWLARLARLESQWRGDEVWVRRPRGGGRASDRQASPPPLRRSLPSPERGRGRRRSRSRSRSRDRGMGTSTDSRNGRRRR